MTNSNKEKREFQTEVKEILNLMINSLYSHKEIFLRELISNSSDALDKLSFNEITNPEIAEKNKHIRLETDSKNNFPMSRCIGSDPGILKNPGGELKIL